MSDPMRATSTKASPPPAPPLPTFQPRRAGVLQRIAETVGLGGTSRPPSRAQTRTTSYKISGRDIEQIHGYQPLPSQTTAHRTGIPIAALDINSDGTRAILAGKDILKIVRFEDGSITEDENLRSNISSTKTVSEEIAKQRSDYLPAKDVKWSSGKYEKFIATAANRGRIALYDVSRAEVERAWAHEHTGDVHKLAFDPHIGALLLSGSHDGTVKMWDLRRLDRASQTIQSSRGFLSKRSGIRDVKWCPTQATDALEFALCTDTGVIQKWDLRKPNQAVLSINAHVKSCLSIDWHPDGKNLVSGGLDKFVKVWDLQSDKGNQKAKFEMKAPQAIRNIKWRPPCWSSELSSTGHWQCTQIATSYNQDDPRVHIWDLRRPHLPFRELERYKNPATDLLWATKDLIWTVGEEGWFTQTDVSFAPLLHHSIAPGTVSWFPDGRYSVFTENIGVRRGSGVEDPALGFLSIPREKPSSGEEMAVSNSFSDEEMAVEGLLPNTFKRRQSRAASAKSTKSQTNTPPAPDGFPPVLSLDKAIPDMFQNKQIGMIGEVTGLALDPEVACLLAESYARPSSEAERRADPGSILQKLEAAFNWNADVCHEVSLHRTSQSWRVLGAVILPELKDWAEKNRSQRLEKVAKHKAAYLKIVEEQISKQAPVLTESSPSGSSKTRNEKERLEKLKENLFKGVITAEKYKALHELDSTSNVTTPMARPLPDSPISDINSPGNRYQNLDEALEKLPQLPPSLLTSHNTAAAASRVLRENPGSVLSRGLSPSTASDSDNSPSKLKHRRAESSQSLRSLQNLSPSTNRPTLQSQALLSNPLAFRPASKVPPAPKPEDRRTALRDYQKQARPLLTFEDPPASPTPSSGIPPQAFGDGSEPSSSDLQPFLIFSTSDSSHETPQDVGLGDIMLGRSLQEGDLGRDYSSDVIGRAYRIHRRAQEEDEQISVGAGSRGHAAQEIDRPAQEAQSPGGGLGRRRRRQDRARDQREREAYDLTQSFGVDGSSDSFRFGLDGIAESHEISTTGSDDGPKAWEDWDEEDYTNYSKEQEKQAAQTSISSSPHEPFKFDHEGPVTRKVVSQAREYHVNPFIVEDSSKTADSKLEHPSESQEDLEELASTEFIFHDFRPIDLTKYNPPNPFAWSALPLITHAIAFDLDTGPACGQFSAHLLAHVHPYFFHQSYRSRPSPEVLAEIDEYGVADRLMHPSLNSRMFENIYWEHVRYLKRMSMFVQMAEFRKLCAEFDYPLVCSEDAGAIHDGLTSETPYSLSIICANRDCRAPMQDGDIVCQRCKTVRSVCPICSSLKYDPALSVSKAEQDHDRSLWAYCHGCGHLAHLGCLEDWLAHPFSEGECPTSNCGHDCGPGETRLSRIAAGAKEAKAEKSARPAAALGDKWKVGQSAAVERARKSLRGLDDRGTQSGDEGRKMRSSFGSRTGKGSFSGMAGQRKSVRLVTPSEEIERSLGRA